LKNRGFEVVAGYKDKKINLPKRKTAASAGYDIEAAEDVTLEPGGSLLIPTGVKAYMQADEVLKIYIRSSLAVKRQLFLLNSVGIIDADYYNNPANEGHIMVAVGNRGKESVTIAKGERLAQGIFVKYLVADGDEAGSGAVRQGGFGSTGSVG